MDPLADLISSVRVAKADYTQVKGGPSWGVKFDNYEHTKYGMVVKGGCYIGLNSQPQLIKVNAGECYLLPRGDGFSLKTNPGTACVPFAELIPELQGRVLDLGRGESETVTEIVGGRFLFGGAQIPAVLGLLPPLIHFKLNRQDFLDIQNTVELLASEIYSDRASALIIDRLTEIFFIQSLRSYILSTTDETLSWLGGAADQRLSKALMLLHRTPQMDWTVEKLAVEVGMSRASFAARFKNLVGQSPMGYLTQLRFSQARRLLADTEMSLFEVATMVGYESESAFNKAFKRHTGCSPGQYRRDRQQVENSIAHCKDRSAT